MKRHHWLYKWAFGDDSFDGQPIIQTVGRVRAKNIVPQGPKSVTLIEIRLPCSRSILVECDLILGSLIELQTQLPVTYQESKYNWGTVCGGIDFNRLKVTFSLVQ